jgi:hypothetical protein
VRGELLGDSPTARVMRETRILMDAAAAQLPPREPPKYGPRPGFRNGEEATFSILLLMARLNEANGVRWPQ